MRDSTTDALPTKTDDPAPETGDLREWLRALLAEELGLPPGAIDPDTPMSAYGLDSIKAVTLLGDIEDHVGFEIDPNALWEFPTVASLADLLTSPTQ
ncbi:acyl carrier protein [Actinomadura algeriensis]|uniref:Acyl carrier protein n=1 Tax=Actinomadura algeriensis TaxID=1679523 RepID=A0ABR9JJP9_9ACTN|nr:acyl carrier protein [Actinomadura algeriensis]MBE1530658.1 acyl carrier protein [Actinomadura algeriensis]